MYEGKVNSIVGNISTIILAEVLHILIDLLEFPDSESFIKQTFFIDSAANNSDRSKSCYQFRNILPKNKNPYRIFLYLSRL